MYLKLKHKNMNEWIVCGPYIKIYKSYYDDLKGVNNNGTEDDLIEFCIQYEGYCETCRYETAGYDTKKLPQHFTHDSMSYLEMEIVNEP